MFSKGQKLIWTRNDGAYPCEVLEIKTVGHTQRACLKVTGWLGTHWETLDYRFKPA